MQGNVSRWIGVFRPALAVLGIAGASWVNTAAAATSFAVSPLAMPIVGMAANDDAITTCDKPSEQSSGYTVASSQGYTYQYAHWRPRRWREPREPESRERYSEPKNNGFSQVHAGFLDPDGDNQGASLVLGYRMGFNVDRNVAIGGQLDWRHGPLCQLRSSLCRYGRSLVRRSPSPSCKCMDPLPFREDEGPQGPSVFRTAPPHPSRYLQAHRGDVEERVSGG
jgi:hypothetical protein